MKTILAGETLPIGEFKTHASFRIEGSSELPPLLLTLHGVEG